jgi:putative hemolysin
MESTHAILLVALLAVSAFFSGSETALVSMTKLRVRRALDDYGDRAKRLSAWLDNSDRLLTTILVGNNLANIAATSVTALIVTSLIDNRTLAVVVNSVVMTSAILVFSEILPKIIAKRMPEPFAIRAIRPLIAFGALFRPVIWAFGGVARGLAFVLGARDAGGDPTSRADVEAVVEAAGEEGNLGSDERVLIEEALGLRTTVVREIMTPRIRMTTIGLDARIAVAKERVAETGFSRIPVESAVDGEFVGVVFAKDLLLAYEAENTPSPLVVADLMRSASFIPEVVTIDRLLEIFRRQHMHMAIVIGQHGDVVGLVTMEDVLEQLVGHIEDEFDIDKFEIRQLSPRRSLVDADARLDDLRRYLGIEFPDGDYETIGGYLIHELGRIPTVGAALRLQGWMIQVYDADERRVLEVALQNVGVEHRTGKAKGD